MMTNEKQYKAKTTISATENILEVNRSKRCLLDFKNLERQFNDKVQSGEYTKTKVLITNGFKYEWRRAHQI